MARFSRRERSSSTSLASSWSEWSEVTRARVEANTVRWKRCRAFESGYHCVHGPRSGTNRSETGCGACPPFSAATVQPLCSHCVVTRSRLRCRVGLWVGGRRCGSVAGAALGGRAWEDWRVSRVRTAVASAGAAPAARAAASLERDRSRPSSGRFCPLLIDAAGSVDACLWQSLHRSDWGRLRNSPERRYTSTV